MDPLVLTLLISGGIFVVSFLLGESFAGWRKNRIIENTIKYLVDEGYLRSEVNEDGELEILPLKSKD